MASANVELVRSILADWQHGDFTSADWAHPEIVFMFVDGPAPGIWTGISGMADGMRDFLSAWSEWRVEADEYRELDDQRVLALVHRLGRGKASGIELQEASSAGAVLFDVHGDKVRKVEIYWKRARALADLSLAPEAD